MHSGISNPLIIIIIPHMRISLKIVFSGQAGNTYYFINLYYQVPTPGQAAMMMARCTKNNKLNGVIEIYKNEMKYL